MKKELGYEINYLDEKIILNKKFMKKPVLTIHLNTTY